MAEEARKRGDHPFGCILVGPDGEVLLEQGNACSSEGDDLITHAEKVLTSRAAKKWKPDFLKLCTMFTSAEPCAVCSGAIYWAGIGRVVYGQSERSLKKMTGDHPENSTLDLLCRTVFAAGQREIVVKGPFLAEEAAKVQADFWKDREH
ncbi:nucleoside deaminase [Breoghania sp.]|uniref:nucleoside deaminase n=1 Tax=Breoghania sp. TaxID=2065378 RepID=UPI0032049677